MVNGFQEYALQTRLGIPLLYGVDAVHGHNNVIGAVIFPHNIGLGATRNPELVEQIGWATAGARSIMASFSSWNGTKVHADKYLLTDLLKDELGFTGFVVSDWGAINQIGADYYQAVVTAINAGVDMNMVPDDYKRFMRTLKEAVEKGGPQSLTQSGKEGGEKGREGAGDCGRQAARSEGDGTRPGGGPNRPDCRRPRPDCRSGVAAQGAGGATG